MFFKKSQKRRASDKESIQKKIRDLNLDLEKLCDDLENHDVVWDDGEEDTEKEEQHQLGRMNGLKHA
jgi:hypothetical protein